MDDPQSKLGLLNVVTLFVVIGLVTRHTGKDMRKTMYHAFRPFHDKMFLKPSFMGFLWLGVLGLFGVSFYYFLTVTANNGWINHLFPNIGYDYDAMWALMFVTIVSIIVYPAFICILDEWHYYYVVENRNFLKDATPVETGESGQTTSVATLDYSNVYQRAAYQTTVSGQSSAKSDIVAEFKENNEKHHQKNYLVKVGGFLLSVAAFVISFLVLVYLGRKYADAHYNNSFLVTFWTWLAGTVLLFIGVLLNAYFSFRKCSCKDQEITESMVKERMLQQSLY